MKIEQKIPEGWSVKKLGELGDIVSGGTPDTNNSDYWDGTVLWLTPSEVSALSNRFITTTIRKITNKGLKQSSAKLLPINSLIICTRATIGDCCINKAPMCTNQGFKNIIVKNNDVNFLYYLVTKNKKELIRKACGSTFLEISKKDIENLKFAIPSLPEQEKIAEILSCWDDGIEKLSALIEKKKIQKKALMQQLLTGKHRLKGFSSPWHEVKLGDICLLISGNAFASDDFQVTEIPLIRISNIDGKNIILDEDTVYLPNDFLDKYSNFIIQPKDLLLAMSGATTGKMGVNKYSFPMLLNQRVCIIRANKTIQDFINQYLLQYNNKILKMSYGGAQPNIGSTDIKKIKLYIPSDIAEQKAIAEILSKADEEIELLNKKLEAFKLEKKALMQQLLTGKIRVKVN